MKRQIQKGLAFSLLAAMAAGSVLQVSAVEIGSGSVGSEETKVTFKKDLVLKDVDTADVTPQTPGVTFAYTITAGAAGSEDVVHDGKTETITFKAGVGAPTIGRAVFTKDDVATDKNGKHVATENVEIDFTGVPFESAGVYRYLVTETGFTTSDDYNYTDTDIPAIDANNNTRNLDVYVNKRPDGTYYISGYVMTRKEDKTNTKGGGFTEDTTPVYDENGTTTPSGGKTATAVSVYNTHDVTLTKQIDGDMIDNQKDFNFNITLPNQTGNAYKLYKTTKDAADAPQTDLTGTNATLTLKNGEKYTIKGLPISSTLTITEQDPGTDYGDPTATKDGEEETVTNRAVSNVGSNGTDNDATDIVVTNHRTNTPPTGILWSIAPYAAMIGLAGLLGVLFIKRRRNDA